MIEKQCKKMEFTKSKSPSRRVFAKKAGATLAAALAVTVAPKTSLATGSGYYYMNATV